MPDVQEAVKELAKLMTSDGIPPWLLASNIVEPNYSSVTLRKDAEHIVVEMACADLDTGAPLVFIYTYDHSPKLLHTESVIGGRHSVMWDRATDMANRVVAIHKMRAGA